MVTVAVQTGITTHTLAAAAVAQAVLAEMLAAAVAPHGLSVPVVQASLTLAVAV
jgi:hypothetical protein